eukprot:jgi/Tetstr1/453540/TSEL_040508.t1
MSYKTLKHLRHPARAGDWFVSTDLADGYYALGIRKEDRDFFTVYYRGELWRLACLPMGLTCSLYYYCKMTAAFTRAAPTLHERLSFPRADSREAALELRARLDTRLDRVGLLRNPNKGVWEPTQVGPHLGLIVDLQRGKFRGPEEKLIALAKAARSARGLWYEDGRAHHIKGKELRAVRHAVESFLPQLRGRRVLLHEDNTAVVAALTNLTYRSPVMMEELRKLWHLMDIHDISIRPRYIQFAANVWADRLSRELDDADWQLNPRIFAYLHRLWGPHHGWADPGVSW